MAIRKIEREKKPTVSVRLREPNVRMSMDYSEEIWWMHRLSEALQEIQDGTRYLTIREKRKAKRERLRASGAVSWLWLYCLVLGKSKYAVLYDLICTPAHRELLGKAPLNGRGEGLGRDEAEGELEDVRDGLQAGG